VVARLSEARFARIALIVVILAAVAIPVFSLAETKISVDSVAEGLTCQCGCGLTVANCNHPQCEFSVPVRAQIEQMIGRGMTRTQIIATFRTQYGEKILSAPTTEGFNLLAWIMPFGMILAGCGLLFVVVGRWRNANATPRQSVTEDSSAFDPDLRKRLEGEIKDDL
jgi:cytochrome c-type biogenesis protein CcmH